MRKQSAEFVATNTGLQKDDGLCGFWSLLFCWCLLLEINLTQTRIGSLTSSDIKTMCQWLWKAYVGHPEGLATEVVQAIFAAFEPHADLSSLPSAVSHLH